MTLHLGVHPNNLHLTLASRWDEPWTTLDVDWVQYPEGRDTGRLLAEGTIDLGGTGSTPPLRDQSLGLDVVYVAASGRRPANGALLVRPDREVRTIADLSGRRIALVDGSFHTAFLARLMEEAGLRLGDATLLDLSPAAGRTPLADGNVDAWIAMAPLLEAVADTGEAAVLATVGDTIPNRSVFWTLESRQLDPDMLATFVADLDALGAKVAADPDAAALRIARNEGEERALRRAIASRDWRVTPADATILGEQRAEAELLVRHGALVAMAVPRSAFAQPGPDRDVQETRHP